MPEMICRIQQNFRSCENLNIELQNKSPKSGAVLSPPQMLPLKILAVLLSIEQYHGRFILVETEKTEKRLVSNDASSEGKVPIGTEPGDKGGGGDYLDLGVMGRSYVTTCK